MFKYYSVYDAEILFYKISFECFCNHRILESNV